MGNTIILLVGPSGSGKTTIANILNEKYGMTSIQSYTTRPERYPGETGHVFLTDDEFDKLENPVAYTEYQGHRYCATAQQVEENDIYIIDPDGVCRFLREYHGSKKPVIVYVSADKKTLMRRMLQRGDGYFASRRRLKKDSAYFGKFLADQSGSSSFYPLYNPDGKAEYCAKKIWKIAKERG